MTQRTDRELLELAARAVGYRTDHKLNSERLMMSPPVIGLCIPGISTCWNPLSDDGDAFRLMVDLDLNVFHAAGSSFACDAEAYIACREDGISARATRRAIVMAAAEIGAAL